MTPRVAIIGAGLAGLAAADRLLSRNVEVTLIDKGRHAGGRFCTRAVDLPDNRTANFDLGPQMLYVRRPGDRLEPAEDRIHFLFGRLPGENPLVSHTIGRVATPDEVVATTPPSGSAIAGGMRELAFRLLSRHRATIDFRDHTIAERLQQTADGWKIHTRSLRDGYATTVTASALILTAPLPQALELLAASGLTLPDDLATGLRAVNYTCAFAIYGMFSGAGPLPDGGAWLGEGPFEWITDNRAKGVTDVVGAFTAITSDAWATDHWAEPDTRIIERLLSTLVPWVGEPLPGVPVGLQRWRWAKPVNPLRTPCAVLRDLALVLAGDGFAATMPDPADAALLSGESAATRVAGLLTALARADDRMTTARPCHFTIEIAVSTPDEARRAASGKADRLELSSGLEVGGLTPSLGTFQAVREIVDLPIYVLLRPRAGGFCYSDSEFRAMFHDAEEFMANGATGLVFGILTPDGEIDRRRCKQLVNVAGGRAVFHRAFDFLPDPLLAIDELIDLGFERILTSGAGSTAEAGTTRLASLVQHAGWQIEILPAGNIRPENAADLARETRCSQIHSSARSPVTDPVLATAARLSVGMGADADGVRFTTDIDLVIAMRAELDRLAASLSSPP